MIIDAFLYTGYDRAALEVRQEVLRGVVDLHVAVQGDMTFQGRYKFPQPVPDGVVTVTAALPLEADTWGREKAQRDACVYLGLNFGSVRTKDWVMVSDCDEIPHPDAIREAVDTGIPMRLETDARQWFMNWRYPDQWQLKQQPVIGRVADYEAMNGAHIARFAGGWNHEHLTPWETAQQVGWHFSGLGDEKVVSKKLRSYAHSEYADQADQLVLMRERREQRRDYLGRFALEPTDDLPLGSWSEFLG